jgi:hypothetical protein
MFKKFRPKFTLTSSAYSGIEWVMGRFGRVPFYIVAWCLVRATYVYLYVGFEYFVPSVLSIELEFIVDIFFPAK